MMLLTKSTAVSVCFWWELDPQRVQPRATALTWPPRPDVPLHPWSPARLSLQEHLPPASVFLRMRWGRVRSGIPSMCGVGPVSLSPMGDAWQMDPHASASRQASLGSTRPCGCARWTWNASLGPALAQLLPCPTPDPPLGEGFQPPRGGCQV